MAPALLFGVLDRFRGRRGSPQSGPVEGGLGLGSKEGFAMGPRLGEKTWLAG